MKPEELKLIQYRFEVDGRAIVVSVDTSYSEDLIKLSLDADILVIDQALYINVTT